MAGDGVESYGIIGMGNPLRGDDGVGLVVAQRACEQLREGGLPVRYRWNVSGGLDLLDDLIGLTGAVIVDAMQTGEHAPGTCVVYDQAQLAELLGTPLVESHGLCLPSVMELGRRCGYRMPGRLVIVGIEAAVTNQIHEGLSPSVEDHLESVIDRVCRRILSWKHEGA